jgi:hypothetical protein
VNFNATYSQLSQISEFAVRKYIFRQVVDIAITQLEVSEKTRQQDSYIQGSLILFYLFGNQQGQALVFNN